MRAEVIITDAVGRSVTVDGDLIEHAIGRQAGKCKSLQEGRPQPEGSMAIPLAQVYVPRERAPGPHPCRGGSTLREDTIMPETVEIRHPHPLTVAGWVRYHLDMVADVSPADLDRLAKEARRANEAATRAALKASRRTNDAAIRAVLRASAKGG